MHLKNYSVLATLATLSIAAPVPVPAPGGLTAQIITAIAPASSSCANAPAAGECRTAEQAAPHISDSFTKYGLTSTAEQAAVLSLMLYESDNFAYNKNHYPGIAGQGTRNMQSPALNLLYAQSLFPASQVAAASAAGPAAVLDLVSGDDYSFGSAAWFLTSQCSTAIRTELQTGSLAGWAAYLTQCVGTTDTADRDAIWTAATKAMGV